MGSLSPQAIVRRNPALVFTDLDDALVMLDPEQGRYYELDRTGARIWTLLEVARSAADMRDALLLEYDVTPERCEREVLAFLNQALELRIVELDSNTANLFSRWKSRVLRG